MKGKTVLWMFTGFPYLRKKLYQGSHFWAKGYRIDTIGVNAGMIQKYQEQCQVQMNLGR